MTDDLVQRLRALAESAIPGPWIECGHSIGGCSCGSIWSKAIDAPVATATIGEWGDDYPEVRFVETDGYRAGNPPGLRPEAYMEKIVYGEIPEKKGKATAAFIAACDPQTILALFDRTTTLEANLAAARADADRELAQRQVAESLLQAAYKTIHRLEAETHQQAGELARLREVPGDDELRHRVSKAIDEFPGKLHSEKIDAVLSVIAPAIDKAVADEREWAARVCEQKAQDYANSNMFRGRITQIGHFGVGAAQACAAAIRGAVTQ